MNQYLPDVELLEVVRSSPAITSSPDNNSQCWAPNFKRYVLTPQVYVNECSPMQYIQQKNFNRMHTNTP